MDFAVFLVVILVHLRLLEGSPLQTPRGAVSPADSGGPAAAEGKADQRVRNRLADAVCSDKEEVEGGTIRWPEQRVAGSVMHYQCPLGSYAYPVAWRVCFRGRWSLLRNSYGESAKKVTCRPVTCVPPSAPAFGSMIPILQKYGWNDTVSFSCYSGFLLLGSARRTCLANGQWSGRLPVCDSAENYCPNPGIPFGGARYGDFFGNGFTVKYSCQSNLVLRGSSERLCLQTGVWSGEEPTCETRYTFDDVEDFASEMMIVKSQIEMAMLPASEADLNPQSQRRQHIFFLMDSSGSVGCYNFQKGLEFIDSFVKRIWKVPKVSVKVLFFDYSHVKTINITADPNKDEPRLLAQTVDCKGDSYFSTSSDDFSQHTEANLEEGLAEAKKMIFAEKEAAKWTLFVMGRKFGGFSLPNSIKEIVEHIHDADIYFDVFAVGLGAVQREQLERIVPKKHVPESGRQYTFVLPSYDSLKEVDDVPDWEDDKAFSLCGVRMKSRPTQRVVLRVFRGKESNKGDWPWQVNIVRNSKTRNTDKETCGGSIISRRWILTAAHCFSDTTEDTEVHVVIGSNTRIEGEKVMVEKVIVHPEYNKYFDYDIALLKLRKDIQYRETVRRVCLPCTKDVQDLIPSPMENWAQTCSYQETRLTYAGGDDSGRLLSGYVAGWGYYDKNKRIGSVSLQHTRVSIARRRECLGISLPNIVFTDRMFCARGEESDSCRGDSGGPLVMNRKEQWIQVGIVSFGRNDKCGEGNFMGYYSSVPHLMSFIREHVADLQYE
ncbi:complement C2-like isoform X1 [Lepisosteus oculatus]|uniref:complement C2-like isoform X1 n=1 Tax=Lepisosteus oculatus TaxID=7918 RepID=UPI003723AFB8